MREKERSRENDEREEEEGDEGIKDGFVCESDKIAASVSHVSSVARRRPFYTRCLFSLSSPNF